MKADAKRFLELVFASAADAAITISTPTDTGWASVHSPSIDYAVESAFDIDAGGKNAYFGIAGRRDGLDQYHRGAAVDLTGLGCIWLDLDVGKVGHASKVCPPDDDAALTILGGLPCAPSIEVSTGGGYHLYWLLDQWCLDVARVTKLCKAWQARAIEVAKTHGWHVDVTGDSTRVLRVPGTFNRKSGIEPRPVVFSAPSEPTRYSLEVLEKSLTGISVSDTPVKAASTVQSIGQQSIDLSVLRASLAEARRSKAHGNEHAKEQAAILGRILDGEPLAEPGERDPTILRATGLLAYWLPASTPWEAALEILRPSLSKMDPAPHDFEHIVEVTRKKWQKQVASRAAADAKRAADDAAIRDIVKSVKDRAAPKPAEIHDENWEALIITAGKDDKPVVCEHNARLFLACAPELRSTIFWNDVTKQIEVRGGPLAGVPEATLDMAAAGYLQRHHNFFGTSGLIGKALLQVARENSYDPIKEYLGELVWDEVPRLDRFLIDRLGSVTTDAGGANIEAHLCRISRKWFIALAARALDPGCQFDNVLVLEGVQGIRKSSLLRALGGEWFCETEVNLEDKDAKLLVSTAWLVELAELTSLLRGRHKGFLTNVTDKFRPPYGRVVETFPRRAIFVGTSNEDMYLSDRTGNRRFWTVRLKDKDIDVETIKAERDQLFAEAVVAYQAGERCWLDRAEAAEAEAQAEARMQESTAFEAIERWWYGEAPMKRPRRLTTLDVANMALQVNTDRVDHRLRVEIGYAMSRLGFEYHLRRDQGVRTRVYEPTTEMLEAAQQTSASRARHLALVESAKPNKEGDK